MPGETEGRGAYSADAIQEVIRKTWGHTELLPLQEEAIGARLAGRDSLVVLPTGGGKSLCYQVPPLLTGGTDVVVSPLIALMKDQVDGLRAAGYPAAALHSNLTSEEAREAEQELMAGRLRLIYLAPERLMMPRTVEMLARLPVRSVAVDEAHCISHWGHDFRPEYRMLAQLRARIPDVSVHAFTATATPRVREDIAAQLQLRDPEVLVGTFDRPNLSYRVLPRVDTTRQVAQVLERHRGQAAIVYCITRKETEQLAEQLSRRKFSAAAYHAGMEREQRRETQDRFAAEKLDVIVATVAFGMGVDRSDVRCVIHAGMPKSIEHYQQESGRAGRDGLEAECVLLYSGQDSLRWSRLMDRAAAESEVEIDPEVQKAARRLLSEMERYCRGLRCRHRKHSEYFGQDYPGDGCGACDVCLSEVEGVEDGSVVAQKLLSNIYRSGQRFGMAALAEILAGADTERTRRWRHERLSTFGLLKDTPQRQIVNWYWQLLDQDLVARTDDEYPILQLNRASMEVLKGERPVQLIAPAKKAPRRTKIETQAWEGVDGDLFERLRALRRDLAELRGVPAYVIFNDKTLRGLARVRPSTEEALMVIPGIGAAKRKRYGAQLVETIREHCEEEGLPVDVGIDF